MVESMSCRSMLVHLIHPGNGCARTNTAKRVGGGSTLRRFAALYSERPGSLRRTLNMNAKYAGKAGHCE
jgi:hypothetical protein